MALADSNRDKKRNITDVIFRRKACNNSDASYDRDADNSTSIRRDANRKRDVRNGMDVRAPPPRDS